MAGGQARLAAGIRTFLPGSKVAQAHISGWVNQVRSEVPPAEVVVPIAQFLDFKITPHELRPDLYPNPGDAIPVEKPTRVSAPVAGPAPF